MSHHFNVWGLVSGVVQACYIGRRINPAISATIKGGTKLTSSGPVCQDTNHDKMPSMGRLDKAGPGVSTIFMQGAACVTGTVCSTRTRNVA